MGKVISRDGQLKMISIVAPAYNEAESLPLLYKEVCRVMEKVGSKFEIIIVENGSADDSLKLLKEFRHLIPLQFL